MRTLDPEFNTGYMLDIETTGLSPVHNSITSLALVEFDIKTFDFIAAIQFRFIGSLYKRTNNPETMKWRKEHGVDEAETNLIEYSIEQGCLAVYNMVDPDNCKKTPLLFCNHTHFDSAFLKGYFDSIIGPKYPFKHNNIYDINSTMLGVNLDPNVVKNLVLHIPAATRAISQYAINPQAHDALYDCLLQIQILKYVHE